MELDASYPENPPLTLVALFFFSFIFLFACISFHFSLCFSVCISFFTCVVPNLIPLRVMLSLVRVHTVVALSVLFASKLKK
jgi:hypothetical protein